MTILALLSVILNLHSYHFRGLSSFVEQVSLGDFIPYRYAAVSQKIVVFQLHLIRQMIQHISTKIKKS